MSNSAGSKDDKEYVEAIKIEKTLGLPVIRHKMKKPTVWEDILKHFEDDGIDPTKFCIVGDRILSDIVMGKKYGM